MHAPLVLVTSLTGIGRATAPAAEQRALGTRAEFLRADGRVETALRSLAGHTDERFGRLAGAANSAGTEGHLGPVTGQSVTVHGTCAAQ